MKIRFAIVGALALMAASVVGFTAAGATAARPATPALSVPITAAQSGGALAGVFKITGFALNSAGQLVANGTFTGTATDAAGVVTNLTNATVSSVVTPAASGPGCQILDLVLGPLHLDLLGLVVDLNRVVLDITAVPAGGLLGQLLCSVANLLSGGLGGLLGQLATLLNQILGQLGL
jgi:hypothetical protein